MNLKSSVLSKLPIVSGLALARMQTVTAAPADPLPSWNVSPAKRAIIAFVGKVTHEDSPDFVPIPQRIAVFDNDGTLWAERPAPVQILFALDRVRALAPEHPKWKTTEPFASVLKRDKKGIAASGMKGIVELIAATHAGMTTDEFDATVKHWIAVAKHPDTGKAYTQTVYKPMLELLSYLRANGFKTFIVSSGGVEFMRPWAEKTYGIPPEQVIGSTGKLKLETRDGKPVLVKQAAVELFDDGPGKPVGIETRIGHRPIAAFGNSDGDLQMLQWATAGSGARLAVLVHHDDAQREYAYDRADKLQRLDKAWNEANARGWTVVSMKDDWKTIFPAAS